MFGRKRKTDLKASGDPGGTHHADNWETKRACSSSGKSPVGEEGEESGLGKPNAPPFEAVFLSNPLDPLR
jgi:hypothetical protein